MTKKPAKKAPTGKQPAKKAPMSSQALAQEMMRLVTQHLGPDELIMPEDVNALMSSLSGPSPHDRLSDAEADAKDEAQQIAFDAMEARSEAQARKLAKRALNLDPDCVDALLVMAGIESDSPREMIEALQNAIAAGERSLGAKFIRQNKGNFWGLIETRPYMRALEQLASLFRAEGFNKDAINIYEKMLALNPNDNQGVRDPLLGLYLAIGGLDEAGDLLQTFEEDASATFAWGRVLERFLSRDLPGAASALNAARKANRFVELYLTGQRGMPKRYPEMYSLGSEEEAILCMDHMALAWGNFKPAVLWLMKQIMQDQPNPSAAKLKIVPVRPEKKHHDQ